MKTTKDVANELQISVDTVRRLVESGGLHAYRIGAQLRFDDNEVDRYLRETSTVSMNDQPTTLAGC